MAMAWSRSPPDDGVECVNAEGNRRALTPNRGRTKRGAAAFRCLPTLLPDLADGLAHVEGSPDREIGIVIGQVANEHSECFLGAVLVVVENIGDEFFSQCLCVHGPSPSLPAP